jgi:hypothetical protein
VLQYYPVIDFLNKNYTEPKVLSITLRDHLYPREFFDGDPNAILSVRRRLSDVLQTKDAPGAWDALLRNGYTHIIIDSNSGLFDAPQADRILIYRNEFIRQCMILEYAQRGIYLFRIRRVEEPPMPWEGINLIGPTNLFQTQGLITILEIPVHQNDLYLVKYYAQGGSADASTATTIYWLDEENEIMARWRVDHRVGARSEPY